MPFGRRLKAAARKLSKLGGKRLVRRKITGNWNSMSEETMALLNGTHRPLHLIEAELTAVSKERLRLASMRSAFERLMNQLSIEELRIRNTLQEDFDSNNGGETVNFSDDSSGIEENMDYDSGFDN